MRNVSVKIAKSVIKAAQDEGLAQEKNIPTDDAELEEWIREQMWEPVYRPLKLIDEDEASALAKGEAGASSSRRTAKFRL